MSKKHFHSLAREAALATQEEMLHVGKSMQQLVIGMPKETSFQERRVALAPESVALLVSRGHDVIIESGAGAESNFTDHDYSENGGKVVYDKKEVFQSNIIMKVSPPSLEEIEMMPGRQTIISALNLPVQSKESFVQMSNKKITAIAWDYIQDKQGIYPIVRAMGEIAGNTSIMLAAEYLSQHTGGRGLMLGGITGVRPTEVVIIGAGTVGENAARAAMGLGASVKVFDNSIYKLKRIQNDLGIHLWTSTIQPSELKKALSNADVVIGAIRSKTGRTPVVVSDEMVQQMKQGSVIVDVSIDRGGCFETSEVTSHENPVYRRHGVIHYCVPNIAARVSRTASYALSNIFAPVILDLGDEGGIVNLIRNQKGFRNGVYLYHGTLTNEDIAKNFDLTWKPLELLIEAI